MAVAFSAGGDGGRKTVPGRIANAKSLGWAIYAAGFAIWLLATWAQATPPYLIGARPRRGGFVTSSPTSKHNSDLRSCSRAWSRLYLGLAYSPGRALLWRTKAARELSRAAFGMNCRISGSAHHCANKKLGAAGFSVRPVCLHGRGQAPGDGSEGWGPARFSSYRKTGGMGYFRIYRAGRVRRFRPRKMWRPSQIYCSVPIIFWTAA